MSVTVTFEYEPGAVVWVASKKRKGTVFQASVFGNSEHGYLVDYDDERAGFDVFPASALERWTVNEDGETPDGLVDGLDPGGPEALGAGVLENRND